MLQRLCPVAKSHRYATRKRIPLEGVDVYLSHSKVYAADCVDCAEGGSQSSEVGNQNKHTKIDRIERVITLHGDKLTEEQRARLLEIANLCPVHKTLESSSVVVSSLQDADTGAANEEMEKKQKKHAAELLMTIPSRWAGSGAAFLYCQQTSFAYCLTRQPLFSA